MKKKLLTLAMLGILSLTAIGFGYAKWSSTVDASVTVNTGTVLIGIRDVGTNDDGSNVGVADTAAEISANPGVASGADPQWTAADGGAGINSELKDVATKLSVNNGDPVGSIGGVDYYGSITETITNAYPYYGPTSLIEIANLGTIPVKLETLEWKWADGSAINDEYYDVYKWSISYPGITTPITGSGTANLLTALAKIQLHADDVLTLTLQEGIRQTAKSDVNTITPQGVSGTANLTVTASQWNEVQ